MANRLFAMKYRRVALVDRGANQEAHVVLSKRLEKGTTKTESDGDHPAGHYAYVPDGEKPSTWKLRIDDAAHVAGAAAALGAGFRGQKVDIPVADVAAVKARVRAAWTKLNPDKGVKDMPAGIAKGDVAGHEFHGNQWTGGSGGGGSAGDSHQSAADAAYAAGIAHADAADAQYATGEGASRGQGQADAAVRAAYDQYAAASADIYGESNTAQARTDFILASQHAGALNTTKRLLPEGSRFAKADPEAGESLEADISEIQAAWRTQHPTSPYLGGMDSWVNETYSDHIIINIGENHYSIPYTQDAEGNFTFDEAASTKVQRTWTPVAKGRAHRAWKRSHPGRPLAEMPERFRIVLSEEEAASIVQELGKSRRWGRTRTRATQADVVKVLDRDGTTDISKEGRKMSTARLARLKDATATIGALLAEVDNTPDSEDGPQGGTGMTKIDELLKELDDETKAEVEATLAKAAEADQLAKDKTDLEAKLEAATKAMDTCPECDAKVVPGASKCPDCGASMTAKRDDRDELAKALADPDLPDTMKTYLQKQAEEKRASDAKAEELQKRVDEDVEKRAVEAQVAKAEKWGNLSIDPAKFGAVMQEVAKGVSAEALAEIERVLASSNALMAEHNILGEVGKSGSAAPDGAGEQLNAMAREIQKKATTEISFEKAYVQAMDTAEGQALVAEMKKEN